MKWYTIGSLSIPATWIAIVGACILTSAGLYLLKRKSVLDWYSNTLFIWLLVWKLSVLLFQLPMVIAHPLSLLYFNGGIKGYWLGFIIANLYTLVKVRGGHLHVINIFHTWLGSIILYEVLLASLNHATFLTIGIQLVAGILFFVFMIRKDQLIWKKQWLILYTGVQAIIYSFNQSLISVSMLTYILMAIFLVGVLRKWEGAK